MSSYLTQNLKSAKKLNLTSGSLSLNDRVGGRNKADFFQFELKSSSSFNLSLTGLKKGAIASILNSQGRAVASSGRTSKTSESMKGGNLDAGVYYLQVKCRNKQDSTKYQIYLSTNPLPTAAPDPVPAPIPTPVPIPASPAPTNVTNVGGQTITPSPLVDIPSNVSSIPTTATTTTRYSYSYYYNGNDTSGDYYTGWVYAKTGKYTAGSFIDINSNLNETGTNGRYQITDSTVMGSSSDVDQVFIDRYYDSQTQSNFTPHQYSKQQASGTSSLGSEYDFIGDTLTTANDFGVDTWAYDTPWQIAIDRVYNPLSQTLGRSTSGYVSARKSPQGTQGYFRVYERGSTIHWSEQYGAVALPDRVESAYNPTGGSGGWLGYPTQAERDWNGGKRTDFEGGYIFWDGQTAKAYRPNESVAYKYKFTHYYNGNNTSADYYTGWVYGNANQYTVGSFVDPNSGNNDIGANGRYLITARESGGTSSDLGKVFVDRYYNKEDGMNYAPFYFSQNQASGTNYLSSEYDFIGNNDSVNKDFGRDTWAFTSDWFEINIADAELRSASRSRFADGTLDRNDMLAILRDAKDGNVIDSSEFSDLKKLTATGDGFIKMPEHVRGLSSRVINGDAANSRYKGATLGNLQAGSSALQMDSLIDKWFLGGDRPTAPTGFTMNYQYANGTLFGNDGTFSYQDIQQGYLGDCYFLGSLGAMALQRRSVIQNMFIDNQDGTFTVKLFGQANGTAAAAHYVTVDRFLPTNVADSQYSGQRFARHDDSNLGLWVALAEKAYAQFAESGLNQRPANNSYGSIVSGNGFLAMPSVSGNDAQYISRYSADYPSLSSLATQFSQGKALIAGSTSSPRSGIYKNHQYVIAGVDLANNSLTLYNPHGAGLSSYFNGEDGKGFLTISYADLQANFDAVEIG
jgi:Calpain family cysteine protease/LGFP repeat